MTEGAALHINYERCTGHGRCYSLVPELFESDDEGVGVVTVARLPSELLAAARRAVDNCPERAISLEDDASA